MERALARVVGDVPSGGLAAAAADLSARYRSGAKARPLQSDAEALAYLATRVPATAAAAASLPKSRLEYTGFTSLSLPTYHAARTRAILLW